MWDSTVPVMGLTMRADSLAEMPEVALPEGIGVRYYQPGDEQIWARLWVSAGEIKTVEDAVKSFHADFDDPELASQRVLFLTENGVPFATAAAWYGKDGPDGEEARLHWVCIDDAYQGRGLSKVLISQALQRAKALGHKNIYLATMTPCWVAIRMYHRFGFRAELSDEKSYEGWRIVSEKANHDFIADAYGKA